MIFWIIKKVLNGEKYILQRLTWIFVTGTKMKKNTKLYKNIYLSQLNLSNFTHFFQYLQLNGERDYQLWAYYSFHLWQNYMTEKDIE